MPREVSFRARFRRAPASAPREEKGTPAAAAGTAADGKTAPPDSDRQRCLDAFTGAFFLHSDFGEGLGYEIHSCIGPHHVCEFYRAQGQPGSEAAAAAAMRLSRLAIEPRRRQLFHL